MAKFVSFQIIHHILSQLVATASTFCDKWPARDNNLSHIAEKNANKSLHLQQQTCDANGFEEQGNAEVDDDASPEMASAPGKDAKDITSDDG